MGKVFDGIDPELGAWMREQHVFFVATAPLSAAGMVNVSPRGLDSLSILDAHTVAWLDLTGSGAENLFARVESEHPGHVGARAVIVVDIARVADSCGWEVPVMEFVEDRDIMRPWAEKKGRGGLAQYRAEKNAHSLDGLPALADAPQPPA